MKLRKQKVLMRYLRSKLLLIGLILLNIFGCTNHEVFNIHSLPKPIKSKDIRCKKNQKGEKYIVAEIFIGIEGDDHFDDNKFLVSRKLYSLREKVIYNNEGKLVNYILYKPNGNISFNRHEIDKEMKLSIEDRFPFEQHWIYEEKKLKNGKNVVSVKRLSCSYLMKKEGHLFKFYKIVKINKGR